MVRYLLRRLSLIVFFTAVVIAVSAPANEVCRFAWLGCRPRELFSTRLAIVFFAAAAALILWAVDAMTRR